MDSQKKIASIFNGLCLLYQLYHFDTPKNIYVNGEWQYLEMVDHIVFE